MKINIKYLFLLVTSLIGFAPNARADASVDINGPDTLCTATAGMPSDFSKTVTVSVSGNNTASVSCPGFALTASASPTSLGASISEAGTFLQTHAGASTVQLLTTGGSGADLVCPPGTGVLACSSTGEIVAPLGTPLIASLTYTFNGTTSGQAALSQTVLDVDFGGQEVIRYQPFTPGAVQIGTVSGGIVNSVLFGFVVGQTYSLVASFGLVMDRCISSFCSASFPDPDLTDIVITDPATGLRVGGITLSGSDGTVYPVNSDITLGQQGSVPEPSPVGGLPVVALVCAAVSKRKNTAQLINSTST